MNNNTLATISPDTTSDNALDLVLNAIKNDPTLQPSTKRAYTRALYNYAGAGLSLLDPDHLAEYCLTKSDSTKSFLKAGINKLAAAIEHQTKSGATPDNIAVSQALIWRSQALAESIQIKTEKGEKVHTWLSGPELQGMISLTRNNGNTLTELRDRVSLGLMSNAMLRRDEVAKLEFADIVERDGYTLCEVTGKGNKKRGVKLSAGLAQDIHTLKKTLKSGFVIRSILQRSGKEWKDKNPGKSFKDHMKNKGYSKIGDYWVGDSISSQSLYNLVGKYGQMIDKDLQPHDLRRSGSRISYDAGVPLDQISLCLGHASIETTMTYIGTSRDWTSQPADFIPY